MFVRLVRLDGLNNRILSTGFGVATEILLSPHDANTSPVIGSKSQPSQRLLDGSVSIITPFVAVITTSLLFPPQPRNNRFAFRSIAIPVGPSPLVMGQ